MFISRRRFLLFAGLTTVIGGALLMSGRGALFIKVIKNTFRLSSPVPQPTIIGRGEWKAKAPNHEAPNELGFAQTATDSEWYVYPNDLTEVYNTVAIHHSAALLLTNETMLDVQKLHMDKNGWADIGYHFGIDRHGTIYEGRDIHVRGASVAGYNTGTIGVVLMGNFQIDSPLDIQLTALQSLVNWLTDTYGLSHLAGHYEFNSESVCPGENMKIHLDSIAQAAGLQRGTGGHIPPA